MADGRLRQRLVLEVARRGGKGLDLRTYRRAIDAAVNVADFVDYEDTFDCAEGIEDAVKSIEAPPERRSCRRGDRVGRVRPGAGGGRDRTHGRLGRPHGRHSGAAPDSPPGGLQAGQARSRGAGQAALRLGVADAEWDTFYGAAATYADVLGSPVWLCTGSWRRPSGPACRPAGRPIATPRRFRQAFSGSPTSWRRWPRRPATWRHWWPSSSAIFRRPMPTFRSPRSTRRPSSRTGPGVGRARASGRFRTAGLRDSRTSWRRNIIAGSGTTRPWP